MSKFNKNKQQIAKNKQKSTENKSNNQIINFDHLTLEHLYEQLELNPQEISSIQKAINKKCQLKKVTKAQEDTIVRPLDKGWFNDKGIKVKYQEAKEIMNFNGAKLYAYIHADYQKDVWTQALNQGMAKSSIGAPGVKLLDKKLFELKELKIFGNDRLYSKEVHKNTSGDFLVIFDHIGNHNEIKKQCSSTKSLSILDDCSAENTISAESEIQLHGNNIGFNDYEA